MTNPYRVIQEEVHSVGGFRTDPVESELAMIYGPSGAGKTFSQLRAAPNFLWLVAPGGTKPFRKALGGYMPEQLIRDDWSIENVTQILEATAGKKNEHGVLIDGVAIDDGSLMAEVSYQRMLAAEGQRSYAFWDKLRDMFVEFRQTARRCGLHVFANFHEKAPGEKNGVPVRGGPRMPMLELTEAVPVLFDFVARCVAEAPSGLSSLSAKKDAPDFWPGRFMIDRRQPLWITKDRDGIALPSGPMNLRQYLLVAGYKLSLPPGLEWFDEVIPAVADAIVAGDADEKAIYQEVADDTIVRLKDEPTFDKYRVKVCIDWILTDIRDRVEILRYHEKTLDKFGVKVDLE